MSFCAEKITIERADNELIQSLSFRVDAGEALQIIGENGSGKTSLLRAICGLQPITNGQFLWNDYPLDDRFWQSILYIAHQNAIKPALSVRENMQIDCTLYPYHADKAEVDFVLTSLDLVEKANTPACQLSLGQQRRLGLARLFLLDAKLWVLDEPFAGLDHKGCVFLERKFFEHLDAKKTIIFTSHQPMILQNNVIKQISL